MDQSSEARLYKNSNSRGEDNKQNESIDDLLRAPAFLIRLDSNETLLKVRRTVAKIKEDSIKERERLKSVMKGAEISRAAGFHWYIEPDSAKYTVLRYSRAICIFANFIILPIL